MTKTNIKIDPKIPNEFYDMSIDDMPVNVINQWFDKPYVETRGTNFTVMCLDGGAWDRPTLKGFFDTKASAINFILKNYED